ncbi:MAG: hypothetical protein RR066_07115 [Mucinivorans sp.]
MTSRKAISFCATAFAVIIIMAHAAVPHHHHSQFCSDNHVSHSVLRCSVERGQLAAPGCSILFFEFLSQDSSFPSFEVGPLAWIVFVAPFFYLDSLEPSLGPIPLLQNLVRQLLPRRAPPVL